MKIFFNHAGRLRSGWRVLIFAGLFVAVLFALSTLLRIAYAVLINLAPSLTPNSYFENVIYRFLFTAAALLAGYICTRGLEGLPWRALGLPLHRNWLRQLLIGSMVGVGSIALAALIATAGGALSFTFSGWGALLAIFRTLLFSGVLFIIAALAEEALFRGYPLQTFTRAHLAWLGVLLTSVPFAAAHLNNPNVVQPFASLNTALAGVWLAAAYLRTRSLWFPLGVHWAWNWALGALFGLPVSGMTNLAPNPLLQGIDRGPAWLTGGSYGIEGGLACTVALIISTIFIWRTPIVTAEPEMLQLTANENPKAERPVSIVADTGTPAI